ncbi:MAG: hypothetical protein V4574_01640 [Pseudomonadota bacterium]
MAVRNRVLLAALAACAACAAPAAYAQTDPLSELDRQIAASQDTDEGIALARSQLADGELTSAAGTLERVLMNDPHADAALLLHASLLCRLDDVPGARAELAEMRAVTISTSGWAEVTAACGPLPRPGGRARP